MPGLRRPLASAACFLLCPRLGSSLPSSSIFKHSSPCSSAHQLIVVSLSSSESSTSSRAPGLSRRPDLTAASSSSSFCRSSNRSGSLSTRDATPRCDVASPSCSFSDDEACLVTKQACHARITNFAFAGAYLPPSSRDLHFSAAAAAAGAKSSSKHPSSPTGRGNDADDRRCWTRQFSRSRCSSSTLDSPGNRVTEADEEVASGRDDGGAREYDDESENDRDDAHKFSDGEKSLSAGSKSIRIRPLLDYGAAEVTMDFGSTSEASTDESDGWELNFADGGLRVPSGGEGQLEAETSLPSGSMSATSSELDVSLDKEDELSEPELLEWSNVYSTNEDSVERGMEVSEPHHDEGGHSNTGRPYLHSLSVAAILEILEKARAKDVSTVRVQESCEWVDHLVFASGRSFRHLSGLADALVYNIKRLSTNVGPNSFPLVEGREGEKWMVVDCGNVVVHLFLEETRSYYNLEEFWREKSKRRLIESA